MINQWSFFLSMLMTVTVPIDSSLVHCTIVKNCYPARQKYFANKEKIKRNMDVLQITIKQVPNFIIILCLFSNLICLNIKDFRYLTKINTNERVSLHNTPRQTV